MTVAVFAVVVDCADPARQATFWSAALAGEMRERNPGEFVVHNPANAGVPLYFMKVPEPKVGKNRLHVDLLADGSMPGEVERLVGLGAKVVEVRQDPDGFDNPDTWTVMADPEGNVFCVTSSATLTGWI